MIIPMRQASEEMIVARNNAMLFLDNLIFNKEVPFDYRFEAATTILRECGTHPLVKEKVNIDNKKCVEMNVVIEKGDQDA